MALNINYTEIFFNFFKNIFYGSKTEVSFGGRKCVRKCVLKIAQKFVLLYQRFCEISLGESSSNNSSPSRNSESGQEDGGENKLSKDDEEDGEKDVRNIILITTWCDLIVMYFSKVWLAKKNIFVAKKIKIDLISTFPQQKYFAGVNLAAIFL